MFEYSPAALPDYVHTVQRTSADLEEVRSQAQNILAGIREFFDSQGANSFEQAQLTINSGIDHGQQVILQHSQVVDTAHQDMIGTDQAAAHSFGF